MRRVLISASENSDAEAVHVLGQFYSNCGDDESAAKAYMRAASLGVVSAYYHTVRFFKKNLTILILNNFKK